MASSVPSGTGGEASSAPVPPLAQLTPAKTQNVLGDVLLSRPRLQDLVREVDPAEQLDEEVHFLFLFLRANFYRCCGCISDKTSHCSLQKLQCFCRLFTDLSYSSVNM
jgi:hypothetical protein